MPPPCRILILNERDPRHPAAGGAEVHIAEIARRLSAMGYQLTQAAVGYPGAPAQERLDGLEVIRLGRIRWYYPRAALLCARETRRGRFDVVVEHLNKVPFCAPAHSAVPVLAVAHHLFGRSAFLQASWPVAAMVVATESLIPWIYRKTPFLAVSQSSKDDLVARGIAAGQIGLIHNGVRLPETPPPRIAVRPCRVAYFGRLERYKRVDLLLRALARLAPRLPALEIVIIGRGSRRVELEQLAGELGLAALTRFTGFASDEVRDSLLAGSRVCVCPSVKEGWGITVVEANALGVPVVATDVPGLRDAVRHDETGLLVADGPPEALVSQLADSIGRLLADEALATRLSAGALAWSRRFDWDTAAGVMAEAVERAREGRTGAIR
ncbi:MAG TPA: glycosyltransferase family 4 protein [Myxococcota bacterium]|jgi:glycosyltransferase involved in cell wall biosynthesis